MNSKSAILLLGLLLLSVFNIIETSENGEEVCKTRLIDMSSIVASLGRVPLRDVRNVVITTQLTKYLSENIQKLALKYNFFVDSSAKIYEFKGWNYLRKSDNENDNLAPALKKNTIHIAIADDNVFPTPSMFATIRRLLMCGKLKGYLNETYKIIGTGTSKCDQSVAHHFWRLMKKYHVHTEGPIPDFQCVLNLSLKPDDE